MLNNFKVKLGAEFFQSRNKIQEIILTSRNISNLELSGVNNDQHNDLNALFIRFGLQLNKLKISNSNVDDFTLKELLRLCVNLKELTLTEVTMIRKLPVVNAVRNESLKILSVHYCDWEIFKLFMKSQLTSLTIKNYLDAATRKNLVIFLATQYRLKELVLLGTSLRSLFQQNDIVCNFNLETLHLDNGIGKNSENCNWNVTAFLRQQEKTLRNIEISGPHHDFISEYVLSSFTNLHSFSLDVRSLPKDEIFYEIFENQQPNYMLQKLKLCGFFFQRPNVKRILLKYPAVRNVELMDWGNESLADMLDFISKNLVHLENLSITEISSSNTKFNALKKLNVNHIRNSTKLIDFIEENEGIEVLKIGLVYISQIKNLINDIKGLNNIKYLSIGGNKTALRAILNNLMLTRDLPEELKTLELLIIGEEKLDDSKKSLKLILPFNPIDLKLKYNILV